MPSPQTILEQLALASNSAVLVAIAWHVATVVAVAALIAGWKPSRRLVGVILAAPLASASAVAFTFGNPFNGMILAALALALTLLALGVPPGPAVRGAAAARISGVILIVFGSFYPHFINNGAPLAYVYEAPTGLIPCPTLSLVIGFALLAGGLGSRPWSLSLSAVGLFYGVFGVARLGVYLDIPLILGAAGLLTLALARRRSAPATAGRSVAGGQAVNAGGP